MTAVLPYQSFHPLGHALLREFITNDMGDGYSQTITSEPPILHADGTGAIASHFGMNKFTLSFSPELNIDELRKRAKELWNFFRDRLDNNNEPFYYYNPSESLSIDLTGANPVGRYLVRLADPNEILSREHFAKFAFQFGGISLVEVREN